MFELSFLSFLKERGLCLSLFELHCKDEQISILDGSEEIRSGFTFVGWNTALDGSKDFYEPRETITMNHYHMDLYVQWDQIEQLETEKQIIPTPLVEITNSQQNSFLFWLYLVCL